MSVSYARLALPIHPRTRLQALGLRRNGTPIWPVLGGDGTDDPGDNPDPDPDADSEPAKDPGPEPDDKDKDPAGADKLGDPGKKALDAMKAERNAARKELADARKRLQSLEDRDKTEAEKLAARAEEAEKRAVDADARAVRAEVKALAADRFADPSDPVGALDLAKYVKDGDVDVDAIAADLDDLLKRKPHWAKTAPAPAKSPTPKPDPTQGTRGEPRQRAGSLTQAVSSALSPTKG